MQGKAGPWKTLEATVNSLVLTVGVRRDNASPLSDWMSFSLNPIPLDKFLKIVDNLVLNVIFH
jgi:hypothetical protein